MRESLSSRIGFILLSAGCAIGIGNVWRFPYVVGQSGGGWFFPIYLFALAVVGIPVMMMEFAVGRAAGRSLICAYGILTPGRRGWGFHGIAGLLGNVLLLMFYTTVTGWMLLYFFKMCAGGFAGLDAGGIASAFAATLADPWRQTAAMLAVTGSAVAVCALGVQRGLECVTKWMMLVLLILIAALAVNSVCLDGAGKGLRFYLLPDFARIRETGIVNVVVNATNQAFFTLSLGIGAMTIFGSYIDRRRTLLGEAIHVVFLDTVVAVSSGLIIIPACFAFGIDAGQGPGLVFVTLPTVFVHMPLGRLWGGLFFLFMFFAAFTTVLAVSECIVAGLMDGFGLTRRKACAMAAVALPILALPCILGFNVWSAFHPLGKGTNILDLEDFILSDLFLPCGALAIALYCCHRFGWGWKRFLTEANAGEGIRFPDGFRLYCAYGIPAVVLTILVLGICRRFG